MELVTFDDSMEWQFVLDYVDFGLRINFESALVHYEKAITVETETLRKQISLSGMQFMFSSWEDFALLLQAFKKRKEEGLPIFQYLWRKGQKKGSSDVPSVFKNYVSARQMLDELGFTSINRRRITRYYNSVSESNPKAKHLGFLDRSQTAYTLSISTAKFEAIYQNLADNVRSIGKLQHQYNELKNRLKHGKGIIEGMVGKDDSNKIAYLIRNENTPNVWEAHWVDVSLASLRNAVIQIAHLHRRSLELLWLFMLQYHQEHVEDYRKIWVGQVKSCQKKLAALGIKI